MFVNELIVAIHMHLKMQSSMGLSEFDNHLAEVQDRLEVDANFDHIGFSASTRFEVDYNHFVLNVAESIISRGSWLNKRTRPV